MQQIKKQQHTLTDADSVQVFIPKNIYLYARQLKDNDDRPPRQKPTLPDVYVHLATEGLRVVKKLKLKPEFKEIGRQPGSVSAQIKYPPELHAKLKALKAKHNVSVMSIFVTFIKVAIAGAE